MSALSSMRQAFGLFAAAVCFGGCLPPPAPPPRACPSAPAPAPPPSTAAASASVDPAKQAAPLIQSPRDAVAAKLCTAAEMGAALGEIAAIDALVSALPDDTSAADPVTERIVGLYGSPCYGHGALARGVAAAEIRAARAASVQRWWQGGGEEFFRDSLSHANAIHLAPSAPKLLAAELLSADDPLRAVLCPSHGAACDPFADGAALDVGRELTRLSLLRDGADDTQESPEQGCVAEVGKAPAEERLARYTHCVQELVKERPELPGAHYRSPAGWLVLRGRRGHYQFCDEVRAYHLETGTAFVASRCSGLVLQSNGSVDQAATSAAAGVRTQVGTMSVDGLRRLALLLWLKDALDMKVQRYARFPLPLSVPMPDPRKGRIFGLGSGRGWAHSGQTSVQYELFDGKAVVLKGSFRWPDAYELWDQAADDLVVSAELSFVEGCPKAALPASLAAPAQLGGVSGVDASQAALKQSADELSAALAALRKRKVCKK